MESKEETPRARYCEDVGHLRCVTHLYGGDGGNEPYHRQSAPCRCRNEQYSFEAPAQRLSLPAHVEEDEPAPQKQSTPRSWKASHWYLGAPAQRLSLPQHLSAQAGSQLLSEKALNGGGGGGGGGSGGRFLAMHALNISCLNVCVPEHSLPYPPTVLKSHA